MNRRAAASRLCMLAMLATLTSTLVWAGSAEARTDHGSSRELRIGQDPGREAVGVRSSRQVDFASLPTATGQRSPYVPALQLPKSRNGLAAPGTITAASLPAFATANGDAAPVQATAFEGFAREAGTFTDGEPPDPWVAVGPEHVIQTVNTGIRISDRSGNSLGEADLFDFFDLGTFYEPGEVAYFDARVIFDSLHQRWIAMQASFDCFPGGGSSVGTGYIDLAVTDSSDPTGDWDLFSIGFANALPDYPAIGTSTDKVVMTANLFDLYPWDDEPMGCVPDMFIGTELDVVAWSELLGNGTVNVDYFVGPGTFPSDYTSWRAALQTPATTPTAFVVARRIGDSDMAYARITGTPAGGGVTTMSPISDLGSIVWPFGDPPPPQQPDATSGFFDDGRPTDAVWKDNRLGVVSTFPCDPAGADPVIRNCVRVTELSTSNASAPTLVQDFLVGEDGADLYFGGIGYALNDGLHVVYTRSSEAAGQYPSSYRTYQAADAANRSLSNRAQISAGSGTYTGIRWGDYVGVAQDPQVPNAVWQGNQYSAGGEDWATEVTQLQTDGSSYVPIAPVRVLDTRTATGLSGVFAANVPRSFQVAGALGIPDEAIAVTGNLTVANQSSGGYVSLTATPVVNPQSSTINVPLGDTRANNVTTPLAGNGKLAAVYKAPAGRTTHLILDITGYFLAGDTEATYATIAPVRVLDTRSGISIGLSGPFQPNVPRTLSVAGANSIPADARAITANLTVVGQTRAGYLSITPGKEANPTTSTLNFPLGDVRANGATVPLNDNGDLSIVFKASGGSTNVLLDVTGYYRDDPSGLQFFPLTPGRILDTRAGVPLSGLTGTFASNTPRQLRVSGHWGVPAGANAITGNLTVVAQSAAGYVSATLASDPNPTTSVLNFPFGDVRANGVTLPLNGQGREWLVYKAAGGKSTHLILDVSGYFD